MSKAFVSYRLTDIYSDMR